MKLLILFFLILQVVASHDVLGQIPAFPGAEGFGSTTVGGRGGRVIKVTNLKDHGPGSFRSALKEKGPRIVIFETGGIINLETKLEINNPFITIAGQTATGDGICLRGHGVGIHTHDVVMRYLRIRPGDIDFGEENIWSGIDALSIDNRNIDSINTQNIIIDHCSFSWAIDENVSIWYSAKNITIQNCIISQGLKQSKHTKGSHSMGMLIGPKTKNISLHHNLFAHNSARNPVFQGEGIYDFRNNIIYDPHWQATAIYYGNGSIRKQELNIVSNYYIKGPHTNMETPLVIRGNSLNVAKVYLNGNIGFIKDTINIASFSENQPVPNEIFIRQPFIAPFVNTNKSIENIEELLNHVGASIKKRDNIDESIINNVRKKNGYYANSKDDYFEWPPYQKGIRFTDSDNDGLPDHWEKDFSLNPNNEYDNILDNDMDGYTNIEEYINDTDPNDFKNIVKTFIDFASSSLQNTEESKIIKIFPNPTSNSATIQLLITSPSHTKLSIYNNQGMLIEKVINDFLYKGEYEIIWGNNTHTPGIYFVKFKTNNAESHFKLLKKGNF